VVHRELLNPLVNGVQLQLLTGCGDRVQQRLHTIDNRITPLFEYEHVHTSLARQTVDRIAP